MDLNEAIAQVLACYKISTKSASIHRIGDGHINKTFQVGGDYVLQQVNTRVFTKPEIITKNVRVATDHLKRVAPDYFFMAPVQNINGDDITRDTDGGVWRMFPFVKEGVTLNEISDPAQAFKAAQAFGRLSHLLSTSDVSFYDETIPRFHDIALRYEQFEEALASAQVGRKKISENVLSGYQEHKDLVDQYEKLIASGNLKLRIMHNDTKINNVLFSKQQDEVICVVDLDTLMPGYFIYDLGDMIRTMVSPVSEEESDYTKIMVRREIAEAIISGYLSEMDSVLTEHEKLAISLAGTMMTFMIGIRFLTDYLSGDYYFRTSYPGQNLVRATNQLVLLNRLRYLDA